MGTELSRKRILVIAVAALALVLLIIFLSIRLYRRSAGREAALEEGVAYLQELEKGDPSKVDDRLARMEEEKIQRNLENYRQLLLQNPDEVWNQFTDLVIVGDSRAEGFEVYEYLTSERVMAEKGLQIDYLYEESTRHTLETLQPTKIWLLFGTNDIGNSTDPAWQDQWIEDYRQAIRDLQELLPNATIFVEAILPVTEAAAAEDPTYNNIETVNKALEKMCKEVGARYEDDGDLLKEHPEYFEPDGIHMNHTFYPVWATNMLMTYYDYIGALESVKNQPQTAEDGEQPAEETAETGEEQAGA